ncbi:hypothetical protein RN001_006726 [Aquatica leii]|uniref:Major facilitator superfamily (MFS) profile domain-containing protein n=1 Tax=Aquatica leii TaxID=1421715 RepID=A0AAN7PDX0_9COLE|nr:hypothetical protein RN001_006726 [Aquatica leii]
MTASENYLDSILIEVGEFGRYQRRICFLVLVASMIAYFPSMIYVFETKQIDHRCEVPECELISSEFAPNWLDNAIPMINNRRSQCTKYKRKNNNTNSCEASDFDRRIVEPCEKYVYQTSEISIIQDFNLHCENNVWRLTLVGTINSVGLFIGLPIAGILSDKFGRKTILIGTLALCGITGLIRSFTNSYEFFITMEFLEAAVGAGSYATAFVIGVEFVGPGKRILIGLLINAAYAIGGVFEGGLAWAFQSWRPLVQVLYALPLLCISYYWLVPESVRWLLNQKKYKKAQDILEHLAKVNKASISKENIHKLCSTTETVEPVKGNAFKELFTSFILVMRFVNCALCWVVTVFVYNGLTINSVQLSGNSYLDIILTILVEIPGAILQYFLVDRIGRRYTLAIGYALSGASSVASIFIPSDIRWLSLIVYLMGKFGISLNICVVYTITTELFPTPLRNSLLSASSMFGRIGSMVAPQIPLLKSTWDPLPLTLFSISSFFACILSLLFPETMNIKLPDTIEEAENISKLREPQNYKKDSIKAVP